MSHTPPDLLPINEEHVLMFAFRYALPRHTAAPSIVMDEIRAKWSRIRSWTQQQMKDEAKREIECAVTYRDCDVETWTQLFALPFTKSQP